MITRWTLPKLAAEWPELSLAAIYDALSYYYERGQEIDREIEENREEYWQNRLGAAWTPSGSTSTRT